MGRIEYNKESIIFRDKAGSAMAFIYFDDEDNLIFKENFPNKIIHEKRAVENKSVGGNVYMDEYGAIVSGDVKEIDAAAVSGSAYKMAEGAVENITTLSQKIYGLQAQIDVLNGKIN